MNEEAKSAIDSLVKARMYVYEKCSAEKVDSDEDVEAVWEGYLTLVGALYAPPASYQMTLDPSGMNPEGQ